MNSRLSALILSSAASAALVISGCAPGPAASTATPLRASVRPTAVTTPAPPSPTDAAGPTTVDVTLMEFAIGTSVAKARAGDVTFDITNEGPDDQHEFVVIKTDLGPTDLPTKADGSVDEEGEGIEVIDEVEELDVDSSEELTVDLEPGAYVLICNIFDADENEAHYQEGMRTSFSVE
jgi:uncharacterized cupredoxin-like copper-binding protein